MSVIDDYLKHVSPNQRAALGRIRRLVKETVPLAEEVITYGMPGFKFQKKYLIAFAPFKDHLSVFPGAGAVEKLKDQLAGYQLSKGTIQFTLDQPLPDKLLKQLVEIRCADILSSKKA